MMLAVHKASQLASSSWCHRGSGVVGHHQGEAGADRARLHNLSQQLRYLREFNNSQLGEPAPRAPTAVMGRRWNESELAGWTLKMLQSEMEPPRSLRC